ncbi:hypothetical protein HW555_006181, partial [Spodoptera exigua]
MSGGVLLAIRYGLSADVRSNWMSSAEDLWVTIKYKSNDRNYNQLNFCVVYLCHEHLGNSYDSQLRNLTSSLSSNINENPDDKFVLMGDFNMPNVEWLGDSNCLQPCGIAAECNLNQYNHCRNISKGRLLDLVFSNTVLSIKACAFPLVPEDDHHKSLDIELNLHHEVPLKQKPIRKRYFETGDYEKINSYLNSYLWDDHLHNNALDDAVSVFYNCLYEAIDKYIPYKIIYPTSFPPWYTASLKKILKEKYKYLRKYRIYGNTSDFDSFVLLRARAKAVEEECYKTYISNTEKAIIKNPKMFWSFIKSNKKGPNSLPSSMAFEGRSCVTGEEICDAFAMYFQSNFLATSGLSAYTSLRNASHISPAQ